MKKRISLVLLLAIMLATCYLAYSSLSQLELDDPFEVDFDE